MPILKQEPGLLLQEIATRWLGGFFL